MVEYIILSRGLIHPFRKDKIHEIRIFHFIKLIPLSFSPLTVSSISVPIPRRRHVSKKFNNSFPWLVPKSIGTVFGIFSSISHFYLWLTWTVNLPKRVISMINFREVAHCANFKKQLKTRSRNWNYFQLLKTPQYLTVPL